MDQKIAATRIVRELVKSENEIDQALLSSASLLATMAQSRLETDAPFLTGQSAIMRLVRSLNSLSAARGDMIRVHAELLKVGQERGAYSLDPNGCPNGSSESEDRAGLMLVA